MGQLHLHGRLRVGDRDCARELLAIPVPLVGRPEADAARGHRIRMSDEEEDEQGQWDDCRDHDRDPPAPDLQPDAMPTSDALGPETLETSHPRESLLGAPATGSGILICEKTHVFHNMGNKCQFVCRSGSMTFKRQCKECKRIEAKARLSLS